MARRTAAFRWALDPTPDQEAVLARHAGARRFAWNQALRLVKDALDAKRRDPTVEVPWSGFDLVKALSAWKRSEDAGRTFAVGSEGRAEVVATGLPWRSEVSAQVFEEAAVDLARALEGFAASSRQERGGRRVGFPRFKRKGRCRDSFRLRAMADGRIRVGSDGHHPRSVALPTVGTVRVHDDTRPLRRMVAKGRARILSATVSRSGDRWYVSLTVEAAEFHPARRHPAREPDDSGGWVGLDRGLSAFVVGASADGTEVARVLPPKPLERGLRHLRRLCREVSRKRPGSANRAKAARRLACHHARTADVRRSFLHETSTTLVKTHDRLCLEDLAVANLVRNRHLARAVEDAGWGDFARMVAYKAAWYGGEVAVAPRFFPSTKACSGCGVVKEAVGLGERTYRCGGCGLVRDRDANAAANLAAWARASMSEAASQAPDRGERGRVTKARGGEGAGCRTPCGGGTIPREAGTP